MSNLKDYIMSCENQFGKKAIFKDPVMSGTPIHQPDLKDCVMGRENIDTMNLKECVMSCVNKK